MEVHSSRNLAIHRNPPVALSTQRLFVPPGKLLFVWDATEDLADVFALMIAALMTASRGGRNLTRRRIAIRA